mgnify:CR=1 FL=1
MRNFWLIISVLWLWTCSGGDKAAGPEEPPIVINLTSLGGQAQKGPFNNGTAINVAELTNTLSPTGRNFSSAITDNSGRFAVANVQLESPYVELRANGYYFNEVSNEISSGQLTLFALSNLTGKSSLNVNILTHLEKNRMVTLMSGDNPKTFAQAKIQAQDEVFAIFDYSRANVPESELLDISQSGAANAKLLAISAIVQGDLTVGQMSQLLANMSTDIASDGTLDDTNLRDTLIENSKNLNMAEVRSNLVAHYTSLGISATIPDFESEVNQFLKPPVVQDIDLSLEEDNAINITLTGSDPEGESITFSIVDDTDNATLTLNGNVVNYTPNTHFNGTDIFTYKANDGTSDSNTGTVTVTVNAVDDEPNTIDVAVSTDEDNAVEVSLSAEEYDGDNYSFAIITDVTSGTTALNGSTVTYTPNQDFNGEDTFTFEATDDTGRTINVATATITVNPVNDAPVANDITNQVTDENRMMQLDITLDATDVDGDALTYNVTSTNNGSVTINDNIATYVPNQDWNGEDTFTYVANDGSLDSNTATVTITVNSVEDAPIAYSVTASLDEDTSGSTIRIKGDGSDSAGSDPDGDDITFIIVSLPSNASIYNDAGGGVPDGDALAVGDEITSYYTIYNPTANYFGTDTFTFKTNDGKADSNIATVTVTVNNVDDQATAEDFTVTTDEDNPAFVQILSSYIDDVDDNDVGPNDIIVNDPTNGTQNHSPCGCSSTSFNYTPNADWNGTDTMTYKVSFQNSPPYHYSELATITVIVNPVNDAPIAYDFSKTVDKNSEITFALRETSPGSNTGTDNEGGVYDPDIETGQDDDITFTLMSQPSNGTAELISNNDIKYTPNTDFVGTDTFTFRGNDGELNSNTATITINVSGVNITQPSKEHTYLTRGKTYSIKWDGYLDDIGIALFSDDSNVLDIAKNLGSVNSYNWTVPTSLNIGDNYKIKVYPMEENESLSDFSNNAFTINPTIIEEKIYGNQYSDDIGAPHIETSDGGFIMGGNQHPQDGKQDAIMRKFDENGNIIWEKLYGNTNWNVSDWFNSIIELSDGSLLATGVTNSGGDNNGDVFLVKTDGNGNEITSKSFGSINTITREYGQGVVQLGNGDFLVASIYDSAAFEYNRIIKFDEDLNYKSHVDLEDNNGLPRQMHEISGGYLIYGWLGDNIYFRKIDEDANILWESTYTIAGNTEIDGVELIEASDSSLYLAGYYNTTTARHGFVANFDTNGSENWTETFQYSLNDGMNLGTTILDIIQTSDGGFLISGRSAKFSFVLADGNNDVPYSQGPIVIKLDSTFEVEWKAIYEGGPSGDAFNSCSEIIVGEFICSGSTSGGDYNPATGTYWGYGATDVYIMRISAN